MPQSPLTASLSVEGPAKRPGMENMGVGGMIYTDQMHIITKVGGMASYAYHIPFEKGKDYHNRLSAGLSIGVLNQRFNYAAATLYEDNDVQVLANSVNGTSFDASLGFDYQYKNLHIGASLLQGLNNSMRFINPNDPTNIEFVHSRHWIFTGSYRFDFSKEGQKHGLYLEPVFLGRMVAGLPFQAEGNLILGLKNIGWIGGGYRSSNTETATSAVCVTAGIEINSRIMAAYTVDLGVTQALNNSMGMQHEFMILCRFGKDDSKLEKQLEALRKKDAELQKAQEGFQAKTDSLDNALAEQAEQAEKKQQELSDKLGEVEKEAEGLKGDVLRNKDEIDSLKNAMQEKKITHKHIGEVFFGTASHKLSKEMQSNLDELKKMLDEYPKDITIYLYGNASVEGNAKANMELAVRRGAAVRKYLMDQGVNAVKVYVIPMGEYNPLNADPNRMELKDRRVDIMVSQDN